KRWDYLINAGGGFDFFLPYFKFGIEFKMAYGLNNLLIQDGTSFSTPIESLKSRNFVLSFTFEG
ncbi:MAG: PorT family protein, partial [Bacteroidetes bacterium]|nr:PorT family protein [Bacteroidota bacterium]